MRYRELTRDAAWSLMIRLQQPNAIIKSLRT
jgi:hypothetical protein